LSRCVWVFALLVGVVMVIVSKISMGKVFIRVVANERETRLLNLPAIIVEQ